MSDENSVSHSVELEDVATGIKEKYSSKGAVVITAEHDGGLSVAASGLSMQELAFKLAVISQYSFWLASEEGRGE